MKFLFAESQCKSGQIRSENPRWGSSLIGLVSLIGGPGGIGLVEVGADMIGASLIYAWGADAAARAFPDKISGDAPIFMNFLFWPGLVILDQKVTGIAAPSRASLLDNAYTEKQVDTIFADSARLNERLKSDKQALMISGNESLSSIREGLRSIAPESSEEFLDVASQRLYLESQAQK